MKACTGVEEMNWAPLTGLLHRNYKYVSLPDPELYDLGADRAEKRNLFLRKNILARDMDKRLAGSSPATPRKAATPGAN